VCSPPLADRREPFALGDRNGEIDVGHSLDLDLDRLDHGHRLTRRVDGARSPISSTGLPSRR
jgi:hypothetical protein